MNNYVIWYPGGSDDNTTWIEYQLSARLGVPLFDQAEVHCTQTPPKLGRYDDRKKIAFIRHESIRLSITESWYANLLDPNVSLYDYDLVIVYTSEPVTLDWDTYRQEVEEQLHTSRIIYMIGGHVGAANPDPNICYVQHSFFSFVSAGNPRPENFGQPVEQKKYLFDALLGTAKVPRLWLMYHLRDSDLNDRTLASIQPFSQPELTQESYDKINTYLPHLVEKYGEITDYSTPELFELEETRWQQFKQKATSIAQRYSNRRIPDWNLGRIPASTLIPWTIYDNTWYSLISETNPAWCDINFATEKTAKCLAANRVFVMFNAPETLKYIRSLGFQTFHGELIDESYDDQHNNEMRWSMAWEQVKKLAEMDPVKVYEYYRPVLEFNAKLMETYAINELSNISKFIYNHEFLQNEISVHADTSFYRQDNGIFYTNQVHIKNTEYFIWDPHLWWELNYSIAKKSEFFPNAEVYRGSSLPGNIVNSFVRDKRKKVAVLFYEKIHRPWTQPTRPFNPDNDEIADLHLGWADLVIIYTTEQMSDWWPVVYGELCRQLHTDKIVIITGGYGNYTDPDPNFVFTNQKSFLSYVAVGNTDLGVNEVTVPFRKYMFDSLIGTAKPNRMALFYKLLSCKFTDQVLINLQPHPDGEVDWDQVRELNPIGFERHGKITNYSSDGLINLEEDEFKTFKLATQDKPAAERVALAIIDRPGRNLPGNKLVLSCVVPWKIYQSSWYSIVCETSGTGATNLFVSEKIGKCLFAKRIFILFSSAGILRHLRSLGFRTFHGDIIDESYDDEPFDRKRINMAWEQVERLHKTDPKVVYAHFREVLEHNHQLMLSWSDQQIHDLREFLQKRLTYLCDRANNKKL